MIDIEDFEDDNSVEELENELELINSTLIYPLDKNDPQLVQYKEELVDKIRALRKRFGMNDLIDTTIGFEPFKHILMTAFIK